MTQYIVSAFAGPGALGNPAAVVLPEQWPEEARMQALAARNNLPETAFLVREGEGFAIRWFTPRDEVDLCGHATLAAAFVLGSVLDSGEEAWVFRSCSGPLRVRREGEGYTLDLPSRPARPAPPLPGLERALGAEVLELYRSRDLVAVVESEAAVAALRPDFAALEALDTGDGVIVTAKGADSDFVSRCFYPKSGVDEDPVTGSAHCNLIPYWSRRLGRRDLTARQLSPRGGVLACRDLGERVEVGGRAVLMRTGAAPL